MVESRMIERLLEERYILDRVLLFQKSSVTLEHVREMAATSARERGIHWIQIRKQRR